MGDIRKFEVEVTQRVEVTLDASKFDAVFMQEFRDSFYGFDTIEEHAEHIAQLQARGLIDISWKSNEFIEGYGPAEEMGLKAEVFETDISDARALPA